MTTIYKIKFVPTKKGGYFNVTIQTPATAQLYFRPVSVGCGWYPELDTAIDAACRDMAKRQPDNVAVEVDDIGCGPCDIGQAQQWLSQVKTPDTAEFHQSLQAHRDRLGLRD